MSGTPADSVFESGILITDQLNQRPHRPSNLEAEVETLRALGQQLTRPPQAILKYLVQAAVNLCQAGTAGVSLIEPLPDGTETFRWVALAGVYEPFEGGTSDREHSPCGVCLSQGSPQLYSHPERHFSCLEAADPPIVEGLVIPLRLEGQALGTIWIASHDEQRQFNNEDVRIMTSLADFTAMALQSSRLRRSAESAHQALDQSQVQTQTLMTNMPGMVYRYAPCAEGDDRFTFVNSGCRDLFEVEPEAALQNAGSIWNLIHTDDRASFHASVASAVENFLPWDWQGRIITPSGQLKWVQGRSRAVQTADRAVWDGLLIDITERKQAERMLVEQKRLLELIVSGYSSEECLSSLCRSISKLDPRVRACILLPNEQCSAFSSAVTSEIPPSFSAGLKDAPINELAIGTCGTAIYSGQPVTCSDIANDHRWSKEWRDLCVAHGILACHSAPILNANGKPFGSLMLCFAEARISTNWENELIQFGTHIASIVFERDRANLALRESESLNRSVVESSADCIKILDLNGCLLTLNQPGRCLLEVEDCSSLLGLSWIEFWQEPDRTQAAQAVSTAILGGVGRFSGYCPTMKGTPKWWDVVVTPILDVTDKPKQLLVVSRDITDAKHREAERTQAEMALRESNDRLAVLSETSRALLQSDQPLLLIETVFQTLKVICGLDIYFNYLVDESGKRLHLASWHGVSESDAKAIQWLDLGQAVCGTAAEERRQIYVSQVQSSTDPKTSIIRALGIQAYAAQPLIAGQKLFGTLSFASCTRTQFTEVEVELMRALCDQMAIAIERAELVHSLQQQAEQLRSANRLKDEFLAVLSHELRTPLNPILGWSKLLKAGNLDAAKTAKALDVIERNAQLQTQLIADLLDVSRILQGKLAMSAEPVDVCVAAQAAIETMRLAAEAKSIQLVSIFPGTVVQVSGDAGRLQQVIWNLLTNAVKFTPPGGRVKLRISASETHAQLQVIDTGAGIVAEFLPFVFDRFRQADYSTTRKFGGLGLGLAIVRQIVELHGGTVSADSAGENQGAMFTIEIPLALSSRQAIVTAVDSVVRHGDLQGIHALVVDDELDSRELIAFVLEQAGAIVTSAASGIEALQTIEQSLPDVVVSDIGMPEMDGYMLLQQIRALSAQQGAQVSAGASGLPQAIALTAYAGEFDQQQALQAGFQKHLAKPVEPNTLIETIRAFVCDALRQPS